jgi:hypothetical protein
MEGELEDRKREDQVPFEEREDLPLPRSKLYVPLDASAELEVPFAWSSLRHYEEQAMLKGRDVFARSGLEPVPGCAAGWGGEAACCADVLVVFPGAGAWFGVVENTLALAGDDDGGTYLRYIAWARQRGLSVVVLCPCLPKYAEKERAYALHAQRVLPLVARRWPASRLLLLGYSLGGKYLLKSVGRELAGRSVRVALVDSVCHQAKHLARLGPRGAEVAHFTCEAGREEPGCRTVYCGTAEHRLAVGAAFPLVTEWLLPEARCATM